MSKSTDTPLDRLPSLTVHSHRRPGFFNPTHINYTTPTSSPSDPPIASWTSRKARKGRYAPKLHTTHWTPPSTSTSSDEKAEGSISRVIESRVKRVDAELKPGLRLDISFWVAVAFVVGSMVWVVNGFLVWFPILKPELAGMTFINAATAMSFLGGSIFLVGAYLGVVEALDRGRESNFGTALGQLLHHHRSIPSARGNPKPITARHDSDTSLPRETDDTAGGNTGVGGAKGFIWWGKPLWHDLGYVAAIVQLFAATIFWISTLTGLPGVIHGFYDEDYSTAIVDVFFWSPQVVGGSGFIISSAILIYEVQERWWKPKFFDIGWQVGVWNLIGAIGFTACGALGYSTNSKAVYQSGLSTWWGSWAFLIGSGFQLWEVIWREPKPENNGTGKGQ